MWDVFISHAWEDKETIARPLADALSKAGLSVWYDELTLTLGDGLRRSIDRGLVESKYGVVILSPHFFAKSWPQRELDGLTTREISSGKVILPVWHNVTREDIERFSPPLADKLGVSTGAGLDSVVREILRAVRPQSIQDSSVSTDKTPGTEVGQKRSIEPSASSRGQVTQRRTLQDSDPVVSRKRIPVPEVPSHAFNLSQYQELIDYAYYSSGLGMGDKAGAVKWAESHSDFFSKHKLTQFKELVDYAYYSSGLGMGDKAKAAEWTEANIDFFSAHSLSKFKELVDFAYYPSGLGMSDKAKAAEWAFQKMGK